MNVPEIALRTFQELKNNSLALELIQLVLKKISKLHDPIKRARYIHRLVDEASQDVFSHPTVQELSPCKKGCHSCCHTQVSVTQDEATLLARKVGEGLEIDLARLETQMQAADNPAAFYTIPYEQRKCVFLDEEGGCRVYEDRPSVCRTNAVLGSSGQCDTSESIQPTRLVKTPNADLIIYAFFLNSPKSGSLPFMVANELELAEE